MLGEPIRGAYGNVKPLVTGCATIPAALVHGALDEQEAELPK